MDGGIGARDVGCLSHEAKCWPAHGGFQHTYHQVTLRLIGLTVQAVNACKERSEQMKKAQGQLDFVATLLCNLPPTFAQEQQDLLYEAAVIVSA